MAKNNEFSAENDRVMRDWQRHKDKIETNYRAAEEGLRTLFKTALGNEKIRNSIQAELREVRHSGKSANYDSEAGYNIIKNDYDPLVDGGSNLETSWSPPED